MAKHLLATSVASAGVKGFQGQNKDKFFLVA